MNRLMNDFNSLKNNILNNGKGNKPIRNLEVNLVPPSHRLGLSKRYNLLHFSSLENYNGGVVTFGDGNLACVKGKGSIVILGYPKLDEVLYVEGLKENLLSISHMGDKEHKVNFHQDFCEIVNKRGKVVIIGHKIVDNCYAINPNFRTPFMCSRAKLDLTKL
ncbi:hypothetical protein CK203_089474 [Vitis vinifera]|uniref:Retrovirus-related Pol polyprotein from transposon TNT 1-94-like beta-barrel domain-containing protein n=1 Tax=Vitis vinifera TaxID=29760 RepID=A0A438E928_VITVI|nr:hypothetical protein CK203_089474 [Vitis vinifera]